MRKRFCSCAAVLLLPPGAFRSAAVSCKTVESGGAVVGQGADRRVFDAARGLQPSGVYVRQDAGRCHLPFLLRIKGQQRQNSRSDHRQSPIAL